jgi:hypothetical protein
MNSSVSCVSGHSASSLGTTAAAGATTTTTTTTTWTMSADRGGGRNIGGEGEEVGAGASRAGSASPTLPAIRGGGFSPGKGEARRGPRNYLVALESGTGSQARRHGGAEDVWEQTSCGVGPETGKSDGDVVAGARSSGARLRNSGSGTGNVSPVREGNVLGRSAARSRRATLVRGGRGVGVEASRLRDLREVIGDRQGMDEAVVERCRKEMQSMGVRSVLPEISCEGLGLYDEKGFLKNTPAGQNEAK